MRFKLDPFSPSGVSVEPEQRASVRQSNGYIGNAVKTIQAGSNITVDATDPNNPIISSTGGGGGGGTGDVTGQASSVDSEIALFSGTGGKTIKRATTTGLLKASSGVIAAAVAGTDYLTPSGNGSSLTGITESQVTNLVSDLAAKAPLASPTFTGTPAAPTATAGTNTTQLATTAFVGTAVSNLVASSPAALDTLNELAAALGNDANFSTTVTNSLALKAPLASPTFTGTPAAPTATAGDNSTKLATTAYADGAVSTAKPFYAVLSATGSSDQTAINSAITACSTAGGGTVHLKAGTYSLSGSILLKSNVTLQGEGDGTILFLANSAGVNVIRNNNTSSATDVNMKIERLQVNGNGNNQPVAPNNTGTGVDAVYFAFADNVTIEDCYIHDGNRHNILMSDSNTSMRVINNRLKNSLGLSNLSTFNVNDLVFVGNTSSGANETGVKNDTSHTVTITGNNFFNNTTHQIYVTNGTNTTISGNITRGGQNGIRVTSNDYVSIVGNNIRTPSQNGIVLLQNCNYLTITGNLIRDIGSASANTYDGINITDSGTGCTDIVITGNTIIDSSSNMRYGVFGGNNTDYVTYGTNEFKGYVTAAMSLTGTHNIATDNVISSLTTTGTSGAATLTGGVLNIPQYSGGGSGITRSIVSVTSTVTAGATANTDYVYLIGASGVLTLPTAVSNTNRYTLKNVHTTNKTVSTTSSQTIDGSTTITLTPNTSVDVISNNTNWVVI